MISKIFQFIKSIGFIDAIFLFAYLTNPLGYGFVFGYYLIISIALRSQFIRKELDSTFLLLLFFSVTYALFYSLNPVAGIQFIFVFSVTPPFLYLWGKYLALKAGSSERIFFVLLCLGFIVSITGLISVLINIKQGGFVQESRNVPMFWTDARKASTGMAALFTFNMCIPAILLASHQRLNKILKISLAVIYILSILCMLRIGNRTQLVITLFTFLISLLYVMPRQTSKQNISLFVLLGLGIFLVFRKISFDLDSDWLSSFAGRMENNGAEDVASGGGRTSRWVKSIEYLFTEPLGWEVKEFGYAHNLWFDALRAGSVISFILLIILSVKSFFQARTAIKKDASNISFNVLIISYYLAVMLLFMVEPIIDGVFFLFVTFWIFMGIINKYNKMTYS